MMGHGWGWCLVRDESACALAAAADGCSPVVVCRDGWAAGL